jgi:hypothetical protein
MNTTHRRHFRTRFHPLSACRRALRTFALAALALPLAVLPAQSQSGHAGEKPAWTQEELEATSLSIQKDIEKLRGTKFTKDVPVKFLNKDQFVAYALERTKEMEPEAKRAGDERILKILGLIPPDMDLLEESLRLLKDQVGGLYDPAAKTFYLLENCPVGIAKIVLAHELGHALDDQIYDIDGTMKKVLDRTDTAAAYQAVVEGSGTSLMTLWTKDHIDQIDLFGMLAMQNEQSAAMASAPMILWKPLLAAYLKGAQFLEAADKFRKQSADPSADLDHAFRAPPQSMEQILHPEKYWDLEQRDEPSPLQQTVTDLPEGWTLLRRDTLGELAIGVRTIAPAQRAKADAKTITGAASMEFTSVASEGWGGDDLILLGQGEDARILRWLTAWDTERDAAEFFGAASMNLSELKANLVQLAGGKALAAQAAIRYAGEREVVIELGFGVRKNDFKAVLATIADR